MQTNLLSLLSLSLSLTAALALPVIPPGQPADQTAIEGGTATFFVNATGTSPLTYQWRRYPSGGVYIELPHATNSTFLLTPAQPTGHRFAVVVCDSTGCRTSRLARLTVVVPPGIVTGPSNQSLIAGESATLRAVANGTPPFSYQWYFNGQARIGANSSNLTFATVQSSHAGAYQLVVTNLYGAATSQVASVAVAPPTLLSRVTNGPVVTDLGQSTGCVWADFDNDGDLDLYVAQYWSPTNYFYRNDGEGQFTRVLDHNSVVTSGYNLAVSAADYDNDGWLDLIATAGGASPTPRRSTLLRNNRDGTFTGVGGGGITNNVGWFPSAQWADYDRDGFVDLLITQSDATESGAYTNLLWRNRGDGTFASVAGNPLVTDRMAGWGLLWSDYDGDGFIDVFVMSFSGRNYLYHNRGPGFFDRITNALTIPVFSPSNASADWGDYDNDGLLDLFVPDGGGGQNHLYHNEGGGVFVDVKDGPMLTPPGGSDGRSVAWGDYDNDGYLDLLVGYGNRNLIYHNNHDRTFTEIKSLAPARDPLPESSFFFNTRAWVDYDNDGFLDLHLTGGSFSNPSLPNSLYHNAGNSNGWLKVKSIGSVANRAAIGAKIRVKATINGETFWQMRELKSGGGFILATPLVAHFGLGDASEVETLRIEWPSGEVQELHDVSANQTLTVIQPPRMAAAISDGEPQFSLRGARYMTYDIQTSTNLVDWQPGPAVTITNLNGTVPIPIPTPEANVNQFYRAVLR